MLPGGMRGKSWRQQWAKVEAARRQAWEELGDVRRSLPGPPVKAKKRDGVEKTAPTLRREESTAVVSLAEAAAQLGLGRRELEAMIAAGKVEVVSVGDWTRMIPASEVKRLAKGHLSSR